MGHPLQNARNEKKDNALAQNRTVPRGVPEASPRDGAWDTKSIRPLVDISEVARLLAVSKITIRRLVHSGELPCVRLTKGGPLRFTLADVEKFIQQHRA